MNLIEFLITSWWFELKTRFVADFVRECQEHMTPEMWKDLYESEDPETWLKDFNDFAIWKDR